MTAEAAGKGEPVLSEWIKLPDVPDMSKPPFDGNPVLIATDHKWTSRIHRVVWTNAPWGSDIYGWAVDDCKFGPHALRGFNDVTHWMPLPEPPKEGE